MAFKEKRIQVFRLMITTINEYRIFLESVETATLLKQYIGQCNILRHDSTCNEEFWHEMIANKVEIPIEEFVNSVDGSKITDDDETLLEYIEHATLVDDKTKTYISNWGDNEAMFLQSSGFEFIFI